MPVIVRVAFDAFKEVEKRMKYRFWHKEQQRSNRAMQLVAQGAVARRCLRHHENTAWVGPPHDKIRAYVCIDCHAAASEPEINDRGFTFEEIPDWELHAIFDSDLERQAQGNPTQFSMR